MDSHIQIIAELKNSLLRMINNGKSFEIAIVLFLIL